MKRCATENKGKVFKPLSPNLNQLEPKIIMKKNINNPAKQLWKVSPQVHKLCVCFHHRRSDENSTESWHKQESNLSTLLTHTVPPAFISHILTTNAGQLRAFQTRRRGMHFIGGSSYVLRPSYFLRPGGIPVNRHVNQLWSKPQRDGAGDSRRFNLHPHLSNENTKLRLVEPALHRSVYMWTSLHVALFCVWISASASARVTKRRSAGRILAMMSLCCGAGDGCIANADGALTPALPGVPSWRMNLPALGFSSSFWHSVTLAVSSLHWAWVTNDSRRGFRLGPNLGQ